jgi:hypothetical protein
VAGLVRALRFPLELPLVALRSPLRAATFGELRAAAVSNESELSSACFICGCPHEDFDQEGGFSVHVRQRHNVWKYVSAWRRKFRCLGGAICVLSFPVQFRPLDLSPACHTGLLPLLCVCVLFSCRRYVNFTSYLRSVLGSVMRSLLLAGQIRVFALASSIVGVTCADACVLLR